MIVDILKQVQEGFYCLTDNAGLSIIAVGFFVALLLSPLYYISQVFQQHDILLQNKMRKDLININKLENKREKHFYTNHIYKKHNYSPRYQFGSLIATIGQIPFLIAGIKLFNKNLSFYNVKFGFINNLSLPDGMIKISEYNVNILPIILFTLAISQINWNDYNKTNKIIDTALSCHMKFLKLNDLFK